MYKFLFFITLLFIYLLGGIIFKVDIIYYDLLKTSFLIHPYIINILNIFMYILITISIVKVISKTNIIRNNDYFFVLIINYLSNMVFPLMFYNLKSPFLGFIFNFIILISSYFLLLETKKIDKTSYKILIPYFIFTIYTTFASILIWILNF